MLAEGPCFKDLSVLARLALQIKAAMCHGAIALSSGIQMLTNSEGHVRLVMASSDAAMAHQLQKRLRAECPWIFQPEYGYESVFFRQERYILMYEHGNNLLSTALEREA